MDAVALAAPIAASFADYFSAASVAIAPAWPLLGLAAAAAWGSVALMSQPRRQQRRRAALRVQPFPAAWRRILRKRVPLVARLPTHLQLRLKGHIQVLLAEKPIIGCQGLAVDDDMRVTIAAQAGLLLLGRQRPDYFPALRQVLLYPGAFVVDRVQTQDGGVLQEQRRALAGESWSQGQVILSWNDAREGAALPDDGRNVVLHEFAHQLDQQTGAANGVPELANAEQRQRWATVMSAAYARLRALSASGLPSILSDYGATNEAEFFAVATEVFFEQAQPLHDEYPELYVEFMRYYGVDPRGW